MANSLDADQMASSEAIWSGSTLFANVGVVVNSRIRVKPAHDKTYKKTCVTSRDKDQSVPLPSMASVLWIA